MASRAIKRTHKRIEYSFILTSILTLFIAFLFIDGFKGYEHGENNYFHLFVNGEPVGTVGVDTNADNLLIEARRKIASESSTLLFMEGALEIKGEEVLFGHIDSDEDVKLAMEDALRKTISQDIRRTVTVKINEYMVTLNNLDEAQKLLQAALDLYDNTGDFTVELSNSGDRDFEVITPSIINNRDLELQRELEAKAAMTQLPADGVSNYIKDWGLSEVISEDEMELEDYELGVLNMSFLEDVEISEGYQPRYKVTRLDEAIDYVTKEQETAGEYTVVAGDTLSGIANKLNIPIVNLVALNSDKLQSENSTIRIGQVLTITVPEPELSVQRTERTFVEEMYDAPVQYVDNDEWFTTQTRVIQQPSAGYRKAIVDVCYTNDKVTSTNVVKENILKEAVPKIVERGTITPPTYVKPISGGRISSYFGYRKSPGGIGSTNHKGIDWATPTGTPVYASCGGVVQSSGWAGGYGYCVSINHPDGKQTRYAHNSSLVVTAGQTVKQGDLIAYSGSTGNSTGPHVHFEILIGGHQVNPLDYI